MQRFVKILLAVTLVMSCYGFAYCAGALRDPDIPDTEQVTYFYELNGDSGTLKEATSVKTLGNKQIYEIISKSKSSDNTIKIDKEKMVVLDFHSVVTNENGVLEIRTSLLDDKAVLKNDEIRITDFENIKYVLRGFPFNDKKQIRVFTGTKSPFTMTLTVVKQEKIKTRFKTIDCYKIEMGVTGAMSLFFPKSYFWYSVVPPHYLVKYESKAFGQKSSLELLDYSISK